MKRDHLDDLRIFEAVARAESLTAAARSLGLSVSAVSRRVTELENRLETRLLRRSSRRVELTEEGRAYFRGTRQVLRELDHLTQSVSRSARAASGTIKVRGTIGFGREVLAPVVGRFCTVYPDITVDLDLAPLPSHFGEEDFDLLISVGKLSDSRFIVRRLLPNRRILCASPAYLRRRGIPRAVEDLARHDCILLREHENDFAVWRFETAEGVRSVRVGGNLVSSDGHVVNHWALSGLGIIRRSIWNLVPHLEAGDLVEVLPELPTQHADVFVVYQKDAYLPYRTKLFLDFLIRESPKHTSRWESGP